VLELLGAMNDAGCRIIKTEHLYEFDGQPGYSLAQGE
jgi:isocitrate dehydrogenase